MSDPEMDLTDIIRHVPLTDLRDPDLRASIESVRQACVETRRRRAEGSDVDTLVSLVRHLVRPLTLIHIDDDPPRLNPRAIERLQATNCVGVVSGGYIDITAEEYETIKWCLNEEDA